MLPDFILEAVPPATYFPLTVYPGLSVSVRNSWTASCQNLRGDAPRISLRDHIASGSDFTRAKASPALR